MPNELKRIFKALQSTVQTTMQAHKFKVDGENRSDHIGGVHPGRLPGGGEVMQGGAEMQERNLMVSFWAGKARLPSFFTHLFSPFRHRKWQANTVAKNVASQDRLPGYVS